MPTNHIASIWELVRERVLNRGLQAPAPILVSTPMLPELERMRTLLDEHLERSLIYGESIMTVTDVDRENNTVTLTPNNREQKIILVDEDGQRSVVTAQTTRPEGEHPMEFTTDEGDIYTTNGETNRAGWPVYYYELPEEPDHGPEPTGPEQASDFQGLESILREDLQDPSGVALMREEMQRQTEMQQAQMAARNFQGGFQAENTDIADRIIRKLNYLLTHGLDRHIEPSAIMLNPSTYSEWLESRETNRRMNFRENTRGIGELSFIHNRWSLRVIVSEHVEENEVRLLI